MNIDNEISDFLSIHIQSILDNDLETYHATTSQDLTLYEWYVTPHRIDGIPFHDFMMENGAERGSSFGASTETDEPDWPLRTRFDFANLHAQRYGNTVIVSYTLLNSTSLSTGVQVTAHNESRVLIKIDGEWKVVHVHKSPAWAAPYQQPCA